MFSSRNISLIMKIFFTIICLLYGQPEFSIRGYSERGDKVELTQHCAEIYFGDNDVETPNISLQIDSIHETLTHWVGYYSYGESCVDSITISKLDSGAVFDPNLPHQWGY